MVLVAALSIALNLLAQSDTIVVMTFNIHHAEGLDGKVDTKRIAEIILDQGASLVALQEVDRGVERTYGRDLISELAKRTNMFYVFGKNINYQNGDYGNAILSKFPIAEWQNHRYKMIREGEQRGLLIAEIGKPNLIFANTHIDYRKDDGERVSNVAEILQLFNSYAGRPVIVCGDFNDTPESRTCNNMKFRFEDAWELEGDGNGFTYPAESAEKRIDYIFISKSNFPNVKVEKIKTIFSNASDHLPVISRIVITK